MKKKHFESTARESSDNFQPAFLLSEEAPVWQKLQKVKTENGLYLVATPIGHLLDISLRGLIILEKVDLILCEDTRVTKKLLQTYNIHTPLLAYHEHNAEKMRPKILEKLHDGNAIALVSDAGMPLISDPGYKLVVEMHEQQIPVTCIPGASACLTGLVISGLPTNQFYFVGFLPQKKKAVSELLTKLKTIETTFIFYDTPNKILTSLKFFQEYFGENKIVIARELTKLYEEILSGTASELIAKISEQPLKGELVVFLANEVEDEVFDEEQILEELVELKKNYSNKELQKLLQEKFKISRNQAYELIHKS